MTDKAPLRIVSLTAENYKRLKAVTITPKGDLIQVTGKNAQGKTSVLDAIWAALGGKNSIPAKPIREGQEKATIRLDLGELIVTRTFKASGTTDLTVESAEGGKYKSPQTMLDAMLGSLTFDPLAFTRLKPKEQADALKGIAKIEVDIDAIDALNRADFENRTNINRWAREARAAAEAIPEQRVPAKVDTGALLDRMTAIQEQAGERNRQELDRQSYRDQIAASRKRAQDGHDRIAKILEEVQALEAWCEQTETYLEGLPPLPEIEDAVDLRTQITVANGANAAADAIEAQQQARAKHLETAATNEAKAQALTEAMAAREKVKADAIAAAKMPVEGLGIANGVVTYNGIPFDQASGAEQLRISTAIAMAGNPRIRVIRIADGSLLDEDSLAMLAEMAHEHDMQVWLECVDSTGKLGVHIEDGEVKADNQQEPKLQPADFQNSPIDPEAFASPALGLPFGE